MNKLVLSLILLLSSFCACTKKDKTTAENQQLENEVVIRATRLYNKNNLPEQDIQSTDTTSKRGRDWYWDYSKTEAEKISEAEAKLPNFNDITEAETWLMRTLELDTYEYVFIKNYHKIFAVLNKYPQQSLDYSFQRLQQKFDCFRVTTSEDKRFRCYTVPIPFMRRDAASIVYYQYLNDADSVCHFIEDTVFWLMDNIKSFDAKDRTIYVINRYDPHSGHTHCWCDFNISLTAFSVSKNKLVPEKIFPPLKSGKKSSDIEEIYDYECWNNLFGKNADKKQRFYFDEANLQYYVLINSTFCKWWPNRNEEGIKYAVYTWNGENFDKKELRSKKLNK